MKNPPSTRGRVFFNKMKRSVIYKSIRDIAKAKLQLKWIDLQKGQLKIPKENYPFPLPALLIEIGDFSYSQLAEHAHIGQGIISLYLYKDLLTDSFKGAKNEDIAIDILDNFDSIYQTFEGLSIAEMTPLVVVKEYKPEYGNKYISFRVDFSTSAQKQKEVDVKKAKPEPEVAAKYKF